MKNQKQKNLINAREINKARYQIGLVLCFVVVIVSLVSIALNISDFYHEGSSEAGLRTIRMYTTLSTIISTLAASICIPFQIEGLLKDRYRLPKWVIEVLFVGASGEFYTLLVALSFIGPRDGFYYAMLAKSNLFQHTIVPISVTILFIFALNEHKIRFSHSFIPLSTTLIYSLVYVIMVFLTKTWNDHYNIGNFLPWPITLLIVLTGNFLVCLLLRFLHNLVSSKISLLIKNYYLESKDYQFDKISDAIKNLAIFESKFYKEGYEIYIPTEIIELLDERYKGNNLSLDIEYDIYLENYLLSIHNKYSSDGDK